mmetsp:Transcript_40145/g.84320  ORF Transcript_40145/g.84320 Transcript_40145/m.84320 type:complete len:362 (-) Transcript_40145:40-1125(-)
MNLNQAFVNDPGAGCASISCPPNSASREGIAPCTPCPDDAGFHRYLGQHEPQCNLGMSEVQILDLFFQKTHGMDWLDVAYRWEPGSSPCERKGIACNDEGQVMKIELPSLGLRGELPPELGSLSKLEVLDLPNNDLTGLLPSDLRFVPLKVLDISGSKLQGVVPPLLCIKEGVNGNGIGPPGYDFGLLWACENIACPKGTYSKIGRAMIPENEGEDGILCEQCYDNPATFFLGRTHCSDINIGGLHIRTDAVGRGFIKSVPVIVVVALMGLFSRYKLSRKKSSANLPPATSEDADIDVEDNDDTQINRSLSTQLWSSSPLEEEEDEHSDDDWTAAYSEAGHDRNVKMLELSKGKPGLPEVT